MTGSYLLLNIIKRAKEAQKVIIAGAYLTGKELYYSLKESEIQTSAFFDNNVKLHGQEIDGVPIVSFTRLNADSCLYIIASVNFHNEIREQLLKLGVKEEKILEYYPEGSYEYEYYKMINLQHYGNELCSDYELIMEPELNIAEPARYAEKLYYGHYGKLINWNAPSLLDEKLNILKTGLYLNNKLIIQCTDKYRVREYIAECGLSNILNELYGVWADYKDIDILKLPDSFALKRNNDCGGVLIVKNKEKEPCLKEKIEKLGKEMTLQYGLEYVEYQYQHIEPCYICEKYIETQDGGYPYDYKFFVMNGKARYILVCVGREKEDEMLRFITDREFRLFPVMPDEEQVTNEYIQQYRPEILNEMISVAERLAEPFPFVRVDLYQHDGKALFGELTFTPLGAINSYINMIGQRIMGSYLDVSEEAYSPKIVSADCRRK